MLGDWLQVGQMRAGWAPSFPKSQTPSLFRQQLLQTYLEIGSLITGVRLTCRLMIGRRHRRRLGVAASGRDARKTVSAPRSTDSDVVAMYIRVEFCF